LSNIVYAKVSLCELSTELPGRLSAHLTANEINLQCNPDSSSNWNWNHTL